VAPPATGDDILALHDEDADEMLVLATLTEPGPFLRQTHRMGNFFGIRVDGRLAAMAGERFRFAGYTEVSGVCTHPDFRGHGFAGRLSRHVAAAIAARGPRSGWTTPVGQAGSSSSGGLAGFRER
jgi:predicted GNAT family acetyltransferase